MARFRAHGVRWFAAPLALLMILSACGGAPAGTPVSTVAPTASGALGAADLAAPVIDPGDDLSENLARQDAEDRTRLRTRAAFPAAVGSGWEGLVAAIDAAIDGAAKGIATEFGVDVPMASRDLLTASIAAPKPVVRPAAASAASATAIVFAALITGHGLGQGGTSNRSGTDTKTITGGDNVATVTAKLTGSVTSSGSRVVGDFTVELTGTTRNTATGVAAQMTGSATAHVEIDGCPDESGSSIGKMSLSSKESVSSHGGGTSSWTRDLSGDFVIAVGDDANISGLTTDVQSRETTIDSEDDGHDLGIRMHARFGSGPSLAGLTMDMGSFDADVTHQENATVADLTLLARSANYGVVAAAILLGHKAETFWRSGKCIEVVVTPKSGDVDANSVTEVVAKVRQRFEGNELTKPVVATLTGVKGVDPAGVKQPAPATFKYTAGPKPGDKGELQLESVSNRGIGTTTVTFTVKSGKWTTNADTPIGQIRGAKCEGVGGTWIVKGTQVMSVVTLTTVWTMTINETTLAGSYTYETVQVIPGPPNSTITGNATGKARIVVNQDGTVLMTVDPAPITLVSTTAGGFPPSVTVTIPGDGRKFLWVVDAAAACT